MQTQNGNMLGAAIYGRLQISVYLTDIGKPADHATVTVTNAGDTPPFNEQLFTDSSGRTEIISLFAPPIDYSLAPDSPKPYSEYNVQASFPGYQTIYINAIQILPDRLALQSINLVPSVGDMNQTQDFVIDQHTLWASFPPKIPEDAVKPLPPGKGLVVLPDPVIPEYIVVHAGVPSDDTAPNYWIPFNDYIKNVVSCEIYSTWPAEAIRANVLAVLSFTLNRVYTEWYRGKGYNFTITNSTAYDQSFVYKRNIFAEISVIVDELFTTFITKPNIRQPLFTQYCDGVEVSCPGWLSQWGSKALGDQGYYAIDILKNYYGQEIFLMNAQKVSGVPTSFPGTPLQEGSTGEAVRTIQEQINAISNNYPALPKLKVDGVYGADTRAAVEQFQYIFDLPSTGIVDFSTWYAISNIYVAVTKLAQLT